MAHTADTADAHHAPTASFWSLFLGCIGVVYGDIGTSPLYAMRESLHYVAADGIDPSEILGVLSLLIWALFIVVTLKYVLLLMRADNNGEGGMLSLMALVRKAVGPSHPSILILGMVGAAMFYADAIVTPSISVLSALEGLKLITNRFDDFIIPIAMIILMLLFYAQSRGTGKMAAWFGPITVVWFSAMAACAIPHIMEYPQVLSAFMPHYGLRFLFDHSGLAMVVIGGIFLAVTGVEALYADMGHFGRKPIQRAWLFFVLPALLTNYLGQGAMIMLNPASIENPFFLMAPEWALAPMVGLATLATVIASQAVITGAFSLTQQAIQLGLIPRLEIRHTSELQAGQIYLPQINILMMIGVLFLVSTFKTSSALASAYGIAVSGTMVVTAILAFIVTRYVWKWSMALSIGIMLPLLFIDVTFLLANFLKLVDGGYVPVLLAIGLVILMGTWVRGTRILMEKAAKDSVSLKDVMEMLSFSKPTRVPGTAIFLTNDPTMAPTALMHNLKHNKVLHQHNVILTVKTASTPRVRSEQRIEWFPIDDDFSRIVLHFGFMETPNIPEMLVKCRKHGLRFDIMSTSFFLGRRTIKPDAQSGMPLWQDNIYILLSRHSTNATDFFQIPIGRVVEMGTQMRL